MPTFPYQLGPYRLERVLGRGGMGIVYAAYDQRLERRVAVKRMLTGSSDSNHRERLRREARNTAQLSHPVIIQVFDLIEGDHSDWIVMELVEGIRLADLLSDGPLGVDRTLKYAVQIAEGLAAAHDLGIVHRDLKTENVMILPNGRVKILDFGIAKKFDVVVEEQGERALSRPGEVIGTSRAMAPEQARGLGISPRSDLFSFGVLLYETITGVSPFRDTSPVKTLTRIVTHQPEPVDELGVDVPRALAELVERLLRKLPELRPASADEVVRELYLLIEAHGVEIRDQPSADAADGEATVSATGLMPNPSVVSASHSYTHFFRVSRLPGRTFSLVALLVAVVATVALVSAVRAPRTEAPDLRVAVTRPVVDDPLRLYEEAMQSLRRIDRPENIDRAITIFQGLIERDSDSAAAHAGLARAYWEKSRNASAGGDPVFLEQALAVAHEGVRLDAYLADARASLGLVQYAQGRYDEAAAELELALELDPTLADVQYGLGKLAEVLDRPEEAENCYRQATELEPEPLYFDALGSFLYDHGRYDDAEAAFLQSLAIAPDNIHALRNLGSLYYAQGRIDEASAKLQAALKIHPNASLYSNLGTIFFSQGLYSKAAAAFEDALGMDGAANRYIFWLNLGDAYRQIPNKELAAQRSYQRGIQMLDDMIESAPSNVRLLSRRALARIRAGDRGGALQDIALLRQSGSGGDLYSLFRLAVAEELCGERENALASLEKALRSGFSLSEARQEPDLQELRIDLRFHHMLVALDGAS